MANDDIPSHFFPEISAGGFSRIDGTLAFYQRVNSLIDDQSVVIDFGAGRGVGHIEDTSPYRRRLRNFKGRVSRAIGIDVDRAVLSNPSLDEAYLISNSGRVELSDGVADVILSDCTFEHITDPISGAREIDRLLKPGGWLCARTPNRFGYIALANRLMPKSVKHAVLRSAQPDRHDEDIFPAVYRLNTRSALLNFFPPSRFEHFVYSWDAEPAYYANNRMIYRAFLLLHLITPSFFKTTLLIFIRKKAI